MLRRRSPQRSTGLADHTDETDRLTHRLADLRLAPIAEAPERRPVLLAGEVHGYQLVPRAGSPSVEVTLDDGTGQVVAIFTGRRQVGGLTGGRRVVVEGVGRRERGRLVLVNPAYTIVE